MIFERKSRKFQVVSGLFVRLVNILLFYKDFPSKNAPGSNEIKSILIFESDRIGDAIWCVPVIQKIMDKDPNMEVTIVTGKTGGKHVFKEMFPKLTCFEVPIPWQNKDIFSLSCWCNFLTTFHDIAKTKRFDASFDLRGDVRNIFFLSLFISSKYLVSNSDASNCKLLTHQYDHLMEHPHMMLSKYAAVKSFFGLTDEELVRSAEVDQIRNKSHFVVNPGASDPVRCMTEPEFSTIVNYCNRNDIKLTVLIPPDWDHNLINFEAYGCQKLSLRLDEFFRTFPISNALYIGMDTGTSHLVCMLNQSSIIIHRYSKGYDQIAPLGFNTCFVQATDSAFDINSYV